MCLYWPQCVCLESTARPVRHGSTSSVVGSCLEKGNRKRPLTEKGDRRGGDGEKGEVVLERKIYKEKREAER